MYVSHNVIKTDFNNICFDSVIWILPRWGPTAVIRVYLERLRCVATWYFLIICWVYTVFDGAELICPLFSKILTICLQKQQVCAVPCKPHHRDTQFHVSPYKKSLKQQPISNTSFRLIGSLHLKLADLHQQPPWILSKVRKYVLLPHNYDLSA